MKVSSIDFAGIDMNDPEATEDHWNGWVRGLFLIGFRPGEEPIRTEGMKLTYELSAIEGWVPSVIGEVA